MQECIFNRMKRSIEFFYLWKKQEIVQKVAIKECCPLSNCRQCRNCASSACQFLPAQLYAARTDVLWTNCNLYLKARDCNTSREREREKSRPDLKNTCFTNRNSLSAVLVIVFHYLSLARLLLFKLCAEECPPAATIWAASSGDRGETGLSTGRPSLTWKIWPPPLIEAPAVSRGAKGGAEGVGEVGGHRPVHFVYWV